MRVLALPLMIVLAAVAPHVVQRGPVTVTESSHPRELRFEVLVPASRDSVWRAFTTGDGLDTWLWRDCSVDLRPGGGWTVHYPGGKTGGGTIQSVHERRDITLHAMAPEWFPTVRSIGTTARFAFESV